LFRGISAKKLKWETAGTKLPQAKPTRASEGFCPAMHRTEPAKLKTVQPFVWPFSYFL